MPKGWTRMTLSIPRAPAAAVAGSARMMPTGSSADATEGAVMAEATRPDPLEERHRPLVMPADEFVPDAAEARAEAAEAKLAEIRRLCDQYGWMSHASWRQHIMAIIDCEGGAVRDRDFAGPVL
jgi:hypothetical protein